MVRNIQLQNTFSGPLDLLLYLVRRDEIDIHDIPIGHVTREYLNELKKMEVIDVDAGGEFLAMASMLTEIKGRMLLPEVENEAEDEDEIYDPRQGLVEALLEYKKFKEVAAELKAMSCAFDSRYSRVVKEPEYTEVVREKAEEMGALDLLAAFQRIARRMLNERAPREIVSEEVPTEVRITQIEELLTQRSRVSFSSILSDSPSEDEMVGFFIAMLELIRMKKIVAQQAVDFSEIYFIAASAVESYDQEQAETEPEVVALGIKEITLVAGSARRSKFVLSSPFSEITLQQLVVGKVENIIGNRYDTLCRRCRREAQPRSDLQRSFGLKLALNLHTRVKPQASPGVESVQFHVNENIEVIPVLAPVISLVAEGLFRAGSKRKRRSGLATIFALYGSLQGTVAGRIQAERGCKSGRLVFLALAPESKSVKGLSRSYNSLEFLRLSAAKPLAKYVQTRGLAAAEVSVDMNRVESSFAAAPRQSLVAVAAATGVVIKDKCRFGLSTIFALPGSLQGTVAGRVQAEHGCKSGRWGFLALTPESKSVKGLSRLYNSLEFLRLTAARPLAKHVQTRGLAAPEEEVAVGTNRIESKQKQVAEVEAVAHIGMGLPVKLAVLFPLQAQPETQQPQSCATTLDFMAPPARHKLLRLKAGLKRNFLKL